MNPDGMVALLNYRVSSLQLQPGRIYADYYGAYMQEDGVTRK